MDTRREFIKKASLLSSGAGLFHILPSSIAKALAIDPAIGSTYLDAEHIVLLMQENRSFDHTYGTLQGVRGFNDPRAIRLPNKNLVWLQSNKFGQTFAPFRFDIKDTKITWMNSLPHSWTNQVDARNNGKYDQWLESKHSGNKDYKAMPLTLGHYTRADIPFYYSLADAFTVCDQHFCSSLTGTTANRLFFWTGTIRDKQNENTVARLWNEDTDYDSMASWKTFPERLEENGVSWKIYQNELSVGTGFEGEEEGWLANFGDNPIEYFTQFNVKLHPEFIADLPNAAKKLAAAIKKREDKLSTLDAGSDEAKKINKEIDRYKKELRINEEDQKNCTLEKWQQLSQREKDLHQKAFVTNRRDPNYHRLTSLYYKDGATNQEVKIPMGDILHQFREDVNKDQLPLVSWLVAPENFSDHPASAWYGAWYISEVMDILTKNPEVWKKTIFILTYDENDGYFDHVPPFVAPHPYKKETGTTSTNIKTGVDYVASAEQQTLQENHVRESSVGLGYRVPMVVASPWSRGGWVNSQVFDHTSSLQFLETFLSHKLKKKIEETNISEWRRAVCGDLTSTFRPYNGEKLDKPTFLERDEFIESIHKAQFKKPPSNFRRLKKKQIAKINKDPRSSSIMPVQEKGIRSSCALPYQLYCDGYLSRDKKLFNISLEASDKLFNDSSAGSPFYIYAPVKYLGEELRTWDYAVMAGDVVIENWAIDNFENQHYHLQVYGPNGFFREFAGLPTDPMIEVSCIYEKEKEKENENEKQLTGNIYILVTNLDVSPHQIIVTDNAYNTGVQVLAAGPASSLEARISIKVDTSKSYRWYDFTIGIKDNASFVRRYAGRVETGKESMTDPFMGREI